jgi:hypothetical protein
MQQQAQTPQNDDNRFSRCVAEYRREQQTQFFNARVDTSSDNRFINFVASERGCKVDDRFSCLKNNDNRFECLRGEVNQPVQHSERPVHYISRVEYESSSQRRGQQLPYREYESVNTAIKRMKEEGTFKVEKWVSPSRMTKAASQDARKPRSKTGLSVDDMDDFPSLMSANGSKSAPATPALKGSAVAAISGCATPLLNAKVMHNSPKVQSLQSEQKEFEEIVLPPKEAEYLALYYEKGKLIKKPVYKDADGNSTFEAPPPQIITIKKPTYNKWSDLLKAE